jgi:fumarate reductase subunit C
MSRPSDPKAMTPRKPGSTRTAPPSVPDDFWTRPRMLVYLLFDATGIVYLLVGLVALRVATALGGGQAKWDALMTSFASPGYLIFHAIALVSALFVGVRFFRLFPKAQPARIGPAKPPPPAVLQAGLYAAWIGITVVLLAVLGGVWP